MKGTIGKSMVFIYHTKHSCNAFLKSTLYFLFGCSLKRTSTEKKVPFNVFLLYLYKKRWKKRVLWSLAGKILYKIGISPSKTATQTS